MTNNKRLIILVLLISASLPFIASQTASSPPSAAFVAPECLISGCSHEICLSKSAPPIASTCQYSPHYECLISQNAKCEIQQSGYCNWTLDENLAKCLEHYNATL